MAISAAPPPRSPRGRGERRVQIVGGVIEISSIPLVFYTAFRRDDYSEYAKKHAALGVLDKV